MIERGIKMDKAARDGAGADADFNNYRLAGLARYGLAWARPPLATPSAKVKSAPTPILLG